MLSNLRAAANSLAQDAWSGGGGRIWLAGAAALGVTAAAVWTAGGAALPLPAAAALAAIFGVACAGAGALAATAAASRARRSHDQAATTLREETNRAKRHIALYDLSTAIYHRWYLELRLEEEARRCRRYGQPVSLIALRIRPRPGPQPADALNAEYAQLVARALRGVDIPASLGRFEYAICLPNTNRSGAKATARRLTALLGELEHEIGIVSYPGDCQDSGRLLAAALEARAPAAAPRRARRKAEAAQPRAPRITVFTSTVRKGQTAAVQARVEPNSECRITFTGPDGAVRRSRALAPKTADADGLVAWFWIIGRKVPDGEAEVAIESGGEKVTVPLTVLAAQEKETSRPLRLVS